MKMSNIRNAVMSRAAMLANLFNNERDIDKACGYPLPEQVTALSYREFYDWHGIANRVVKVWPDACWETYPIISETPGGDETVWQDELKKIATQSRLFNFMYRLDEVSGIGQYGVMLLGIDDGKELKEPVDGVVDETMGESGNTNEPVFIGTTAEEMDAEEDDEETDTLPTKKPKPGVKPPVVRNAVDTVGPGPVIAPVEDVAEKDPKKTATGKARRKLTFVRVFDQSAVKVGTLVTDKTDPRYGRPLTYTIKLDEPTELSGNAVPQTSETEVHWTRVIHVADNRVSSELYGNPRQQPVFHRLWDLRKILGGNGEMFWKGGFPGTAFEVSPELAGDVELDKEALAAEMDAYAEGLKRYFAVVGMKANQLQPNIESPVPSFEIAVKAIAITINVPSRIFMGTEEGQLAGEQDKKGWDKRVAKRFDDHCEPMIVRPIIDRLIAMGVLEYPAHDEYHVVRNVDTEQTRKEMAETAKLLVEAIAAYISSNCDLLIGEEDFLVKLLGFEPDEAKAILEAAQKSMDEGGGNTLADDHGPEPIMPFGPDGKPIIPDAPFGANGNGPQEKEESEDDADQEDVRPVAIPKGPKR